MTERVFKSYLAPLLSEEYKEGIHKLQAQRERGEITPADCASKCLELMAYFLEEEKGEK